MCAKWDFLMLNLLLIDWIVIKNPITSWFVLRDLCFSGCFFIYGFVRKRSDVMLCLLNFVFDSFITPKVKVLTFLDKIIKETRHIILFTRRNFRLHKPHDSRSNKKSQKTTNKEPVLRPLRGLIFLNILLFRRNSIVFVLIVCTCIKPGIRQLFSIFFICLMCMILPFYKRISVLNFLVFSVLFIPVVFMWEENTSWLKVYQIKLF